MEERQILQQNSEDNLRGLWNLKWVRPYESLWSLINTYRTVNFIRNNVDAMKSLGLNMRYPVVDFYLPYGIYCNISLNKNDLNKIIAKLSPTWHRKQLKIMFDKDGISQFISKQIKFCPKCMENGYHSVFHQLKGLRKCPFHPEIDLVSYLKQQYIFGKQSPFEYNLSNQRDAMRFYRINILDKETNLEDGTVLNLPIDWLEMPEIEEYVQAWGGIRNEYDKIRAIGTNIENKNIGSFLLKTNKLSTYITIYNRKESDSLIIEDIKKRYSNCGLKKLDTMNISTYNFEKYYTFLFIIEMLAPFTDDEIDYKCYQIERGKDIYFNDEIGAILLFLLILIGNNESIEKLLNIINNNFKHFKYYYTTYTIDYPNIYIHNLKLDSDIPISAQYHILQEYINMNWKSFKEFIVKRNCIGKEITQNMSSIYNHFIYIENESIISIYKY